MITTLSQPMNIPGIPNNENDCAAACTKDCGGDRSRSAGSHAEDIPWRGICVAEVMAFKFEPLVDRLIEKSGWTRRYAEEVVNEMKRFLYLCGTSNDGPFAPSTPIDEAWHAFILFTEDYENFCKEFFGRFIHHRPRRKGEPAAKVDRARLTLFAARAHFGHLSAIWNYTNKNGTLLDANLTTDGTTAEANCGPGACAAICQDRS